MTALREQAEAAAGEAVVKAASSAMTEAGTAAAAVGELGPAEREAPPVVEAVDRSGSTLETQPRP